MQFTGVIAVDGTGASGKSVCAVVAEKLGCALLETGVIYRTITLMVLRAKIDPTNTTDVEEFVTQNHARLSFQGNQLMCDGLAVSGEIRTREINKNVWKISKQVAVRKLVVPLQRSFNGGERLIAEGRDIGSVIFPDAQIKFFLTADLKVRAERRFKQYCEANPHYVGTLIEETRNLEIRDKEDTERPDSPLVRLPEAVFIDSTFMTKEEVIDKMLEACRKSI